MDDDELTIIQQQQLLLLLLLNGAGRRWKAGYRNPAMHLGRWRASPLLLLLKHPPLRQLQKQTRHQQQQHL